MATNPRIPDRRDVPTLVSQRKKKASAPLIIFGIIAAAVLLAAILYFLPRAPRAGSYPSNATAPVQPTGGQIRLSNATLSAAPVGDQLYIYARLSNQGQTPINGLKLNLTFPGQNQQPVSTISTTNVESFQNQKAESLVDNPIKVNETRDIRITVQHVPNGWNHQMPEISVQDVTGFGNK